MQAREQLGHLGQLIPRLQAARIGQQPQLRGAERLLLLADRRVGALEGGAVGLEAEYGDAARVQSSDPVLQASRTGPKFLLVELTCRRRHPLHQVRYADPQSWEIALLGGHQDAIGKTSRMEQLPKPVARAGEVQTELARKPSWIDAAKEHRKIRPDQIGNPLAEGWCLRFHSFTGRGPVSARRATAGEEMVVPSVTAVSLWPLAGPPARSHLDQVRPVREHFEVDMLPHPF